MSVSIIESNYSNDEELHRLIQNPMNECVSLRQLILIGSSFNVHKCQELWVVAWLRPIFLRSETISLVIPENLSE